MLFRSVSQSRYDERGAVLIGNILAEILSKAMPAMRPVVIERPVEYRPPEPVIAPAPEPETEPEAVPIPVGQTKGDLLRQWLIDNPDKLKLNVFVDEIALRAGNEMSPPISGRT